MLFTVHWADNFGTTAKLFTVYLDALDWIYMLVDLGYAPYICCEEGN